MSHEQRTPASEAGGDRQAAARTPPCRGLAPARRTGRVYFRRGVALYQQGKLEEAAAAFREASRLNPDDPSSGVFLRLILVGQDKWEEAIAACRNAVWRRPGNASDYSFLGDVLEMRGKPAKAVGAYRKAIRLQPFDVWHRMSLGWALLKLEKFDEAIAEFRECVRLEPDNWIGHGALGMAFRLRGSPEQAIAEFREAIRLLPDNAVSHGALGFALMDQGKRDEAIASFTEAIRLVPALAVAYLGRARASIRHRRRGQCRERRTQGPRTAAITAATGRRMRSRRIEALTEPASLADGDRSPWAMVSGSPPTSIASIGKRLLGALRFAERRQWARALAHYQLRRQALSSAEVEQAIASGSARSSCLRPDHDEIHH